MNAAIRFLQLVGLAAALAWAGPPTVDWVDRFQATRESRAFWRELLAAAEPGGVENAAAAEDKRLPRGETAAYWLSVPGVGIETLVVYGGDEESLKRYAVLDGGEVGMGTGTEGPVVISAHRDLHFRPLKDLEEGEEFSLQDVLGQTRRFRVVAEETFPADELPERIRAGGARHAVALVTCYPFYYVGPAPERYVAWGDEVE